MSETAIRGGQVRLGLGSTDLGHAHSIPQCRCVLSTKCRKEGRKRRHRTGVECHGGWGNVTEKHQAYRMIPTSPHHKDALESP